MEVKFDRNKPAGDQLANQNMETLLLDYTKTGFNVTKTNFMRASKTRLFNESAKRYYQINQSNYNKQNHVKESIGIKSNFISGLPENMG